MILKNGLVSGAHNIRTFLWQHAKLSEADKYKLTVKKLADFDKVYVIKYYKFNTNAFNNKTVFLQEAETEHFERALRAYVNRGAHEPGTNTCVVVESGVTWTMYLDDNDFPNTIYPKTGIIQSKKARDKKDDNKGTR